MNGQGRRQSCFDQAAREYLYTFDGILDEMIWCMTGAEPGGSISHNFIIEMIPHHQSAIEMSRNILKYTKNESLCRIATQIIEEQTKGIEEMCRMEKCCCKVRNTQEDLCRYSQDMEKIMREMFAQMKGACATGQVSCDFMWEMIPHHEGAVRMAETALCFPLCQELGPVLQNIIASQKKGIEQMRNLQRCMGC